MSDSPQPISIGDRLAWAGLVMVAMLCLARAMIEHDPFPWWQSDPFVFSPPIIGLTPRWALLLNIGLVLGSCISLFGHALRGRGIPLIWGLVLTAALGVLGYHALVDLERLLESSTLAAVASVFASVGLCHTLPGARRVLGAVVVGFALLLVCVGIFEVYVSHPQTLKAYEQGRDSFLAARGWSPESYEALSYERRLRNPEPVAWFGLTNVFSSFMAAGAAGCFAIAMNASKTQRVVRAILLLGAIACVFGLVMSGSKGGYGVLLIGLVLALLPAFGKSGLLNGRVIVLFCLCVVAALILRGVLGERLGERSLLFRWQYLFGSLSIWLHHPIVGSGPGLFQQQYALLKPDLSPEDVASAHNFALDWLAMLGLGGIALLAFVLRMILSMRPVEQDSLSECPEPTPNTTQITSLHPPQWHCKLALLVVVLPTLLALRMQSPVLNLAGMMTALIGAGLWSGMAMMLIRTKIQATAMTAGLFVVAAVLVVHGMLEVTGTLITAAPLWALMIAIPTRTGSAPPRYRRAIPIVPLLGLVVILSLRWVPLNRWERSLHSAAANAQAIASINTTLNALETSPDPSRELREAQSMILDLTARPVSASLDSIIPELNRAEVEARQAAIERLGRALSERPSHTATRIALSQQMLWIASVAQSSGREDLATQLWDQATGLFETTPLDASGERWAGSIWAGRASSMPQSPERGRWLGRAQAHWQRALELAPHSPQTALLLMENAVELELPMIASEWAARAIELHEQTRLDPLRGLAPADLARARAIAGD